jgi:hypothetical protein
MGVNSRAGLTVLALVVSFHLTAVYAESEHDVRAQTTECDTPSCKRDRERMEKEKPPRTSFLDRVHLDVLGAPPEIGSSASVYGLVGAHLTIAEIGRIHLYGPPGVMVAMHSEAESSGRWRPMTALTWGISIRLVDFRLRGAPRRTVMFLNLTKLWTWGDFSQGTDFAGLSFAWKRDRDQARPERR